MPSGSGDNEVMRLILYSKNGYWPHYFIAVPCGVYQIFLSQVKTVSATDGFDFGKTNEKKFHVNATFVVKITETRVKNSNYDSHSNCNSAIPHT